jgi:signal transduction histidine kinase
MSASSNPDLNPTQLSYETVINSTRDMIWAVDRGYCLLFFNTALQHLYTQLLPHVPPLEVGVNIPDISPPAWANYFRKQYDRAFAGEQFQVVLDNEDVTLEMTFSPIFGDDQLILGASVFARDSSERKQREEDLRHINEELQSRVNEISALHRMVQTAVELRDPQAALASLAEQMTMLFAARGTSITLLNDDHSALAIAADFDVFPDSYNSVGISLPLNTMPLAAQFLEQPAFYAVPMAMVEQSLGPLVSRLIPRPAAYLNILPLVIRGTVIGAAVMIAERSVDAFVPTERHLLETVVAQVASVIDHMRLFETAQRAREQAEAASQAKSRFLATMSHELRTPLNSVLGYVQLLQERQKLSKEQRFGLAMIEQSSNHLLQLINDVLDLASVESGKARLNESLVALGPFFISIAEMIKPRAQSKQVAFRLDLFHEDPLQCTIVASFDERRVRQIVLNLLGNAVKFTDQGYVTLRVELREPTPDTHLLYIAVEDTGLGIDTDALAHIFEPFYQAGHGHRQASGTGLGLAVSSELLQMMGSRLHVNSILGVGSSFWFELPITMQRGGMLAQPGRPSPTEEQPASPQATPLLPAEEVTALLQYVVIGDLQAIEQRADQLRQTHPALAQTTQALITMVRDFDLQKIRELLHNQSILAQEGA